ncbi:hypothetical protein [Nocardioides hungaricus]
MLTRRLLALALLVAGLLAGTTTPATAEGCRPMGDTLERQTMRADAVFSGVVAGRERAGSTVTFSVDVDLVYKGDVGERASIETPRKLCALPAFEAGDEVLWFANKDGDRVLAARGGGTTSASPAHLRRVESLLGPGTSATPPEPATATFTMVAGEKTALSRLAAPGVALVIVGLLGLLLVAALGRRRA